MNFKHLRLFLIPLLQFCFLPLHAQSPYYFQKDGLLGLKDYKSNTIVLPAEYDNFYPCKNVFYVQKDIYEAVKTESHSSSFIKTEKNSLYGLINQSGKIIFPAEYTDLSGNIYYGYLTLKKNDEWLVADTNGVIIARSAAQIKVTASYFYSTVKKNTDEFYSTVFDHHGNKVLELNYEIDQFNHDNTLLLVHDKKFRSYVYTIKGNLIVAENYTKRPSTHNIDFIGNYIKFEYNKYVKLYNRNGKELVNDSCDVRVYSDNIILLYDKAKKWRWLDSTLHPLVPYQAAGSLSKYEAVVGNYFVMTALIGDKTVRKAFLSDGTEVFKEGFIGIFYTRFGYILTTATGNFVADDKGNIITGLPCKTIQYDNSTPTAWGARFTPYMTGKDDHYSYVFDCRDGHILFKSNLQQCKYSKVWTAANGKYFISTSNNDKYGLIDITGKEILPMNSVSVRVNDFIEIGEGNNLRSYYTLDMKPLYAKQKIYKDERSIPDVVLIEEDIMNHSGYLFYHPDSTTPWLKARAFQIQNNFFVQTRNANDKCGLFTLTGDTLLPEIYTEILPINNRYYTVRKDNLFGIVDIHNRTAIPILYKSYDVANAKPDKIISLTKDKLIDCYLFKRDTFKAVFDQGRYTYIGNLVTNNQGQIYFRAFINDKCGLITYEKVITPCTFSDIGLMRDLLQFRLKDSSCFATVENPLVRTDYFDRTASIEHENTGNFFYVIKKNKYGIMDHKLNLILPPIYNQIKNPGKDLYVIQNSTYKYAIYAGSKWITPFNIDSYENLGQNDYYPFYYKQNNLYYLYSPAGIAGPYTGLTVKRASRLGELIIMEKNGTYCLWENKTGKYLTDSIYTKMNFTINNFLLVKKEKNYGVLDANGYIKVPFTYDSITTFYETKNYFPVKKNNKWGICDTSGVEVIHCEYDEILNTAEYLKREFDSNPGKNNSTNNSRYFYPDKEMLGNIKLKQNQVIVMKGGKYGLITIQGQTLLPSTYDYIYDEAAGYIVESEKKFGYVNHKGELVLPIQYEQLDKIGKENYFCLSKNDKAGVINESGSIIIPVIYDDIEFDEDGNVFVIYDGDSMGIADTTGKMLLSVKYPDIEVFETHCFVYNNDDLIAIYSIPLKKFVTGFIFDGYKEEDAYSRKRDNFYIMEKEGKDTDLYGLYIPDDENCPLKPQFDKIDYDYSKEAFELYYTTNRGKRLYRLYSKKNVLSKPIEY